MKLNFKLNFTNARKPYLGAAVIQINYQDQFMVMVECAMRS